MHPTDQLRLAELLCSRLCHDLVGPIGAVGNGIELVSEFGEELTADAMELVAGSAATAAARLQYFRLAFGECSDNLLNGDEARRLATGMFDGRRLALRWTAGGSNGMPAVWKLALVLLMVGAEALPRGGVLHLVTADAAGVEVLIHGQGAALRPGSATALLAEDLAGITAHTVVAFFAGRLAERLGYRMTVEPRPDGLALCAAASLHPVAGAGMGFTRS